MSKFIYYENGFYSSSDDPCGYIRADSIMALEVSEVYLASGGSTAFVVKALVGGMWINASHYCQSKKDAVREMEILCGELEGERK